MCGAIIGISIILNFLSWLWSVLWPALGYITVGIVLFCLLAGIVTAIKEKLNGQPNTGQSKSQKVAVTSKWMNCPACGWLIVDFSKNICPSCGQSIDLPELPNSAVAIEKTPKRSWVVIGIFSVFFCLCTAIYVTTNTPNEQDVSQRREEMRQQAQQTAEQEFEREWKERERKAQALRSKPNPSESLIKTYRTRSGYLAANTEDGLQAAMGSREAADRLIAKGLVTREMPADVEVELLEGRRGGARVRIKKTGDIIWIESRALEFLSASSAPSIPSVSASRSSSTKVQEGYLSAVKIKELLDLFSDGVNIEDVRAVFGDPVYKEMWLFEKDNIRISITFQKKPGNKISDMVITLFFDSSMERYNTSALYMQQFDAIMHKLHSTNTQTIWKDTNGFPYTMSTSEIDGVPCLIFMRMRAN